MKTNKTSLTYYKEIIGNTKTSRYGKRFLYTVIADTFERIFISTLRVLPWMSTSVYSRASLTRNTSS